MPRKNGHYTIVDQIILIMARMGRVYWSEITEDFRYVGVGIKRREYLCDRLLGPVSYCFNPSIPWPDGKKSKAKAYWFRTKEGTYGLNLNGWKRYQELRG
jgi:hypothetical protein